MTELACLKCNNGVSVILEEFEVASSRVYQEKVDHLITIGVKNTFRYFDSYMYSTKYDWR